MPSLYDMDQSPTYDKVSCIFYDIESMKNAFTVVTYLAKINTFEVFYAVPKGIYDVTNPAHEPISPHTQLESFIRTTIPELPLYTQNQHPCFIFHDLSTVAGSRALIQRFGLSSAQYQVAQYYEKNIIDVDYSTIMGDNQPAFCHPISDVSSDFDPYNNVDHSYFFGYNSERYDLVILSFVMNILSRSPLGFTDSMVEEIRGFNDLLFSRYRHNMTDVFSHYDAHQNRKIYAPLKKIRESWLATGRYLDLSNALTSFAALKRISAFKGGSVKTHEGLERDPQLHTYEDFLNLIAYNVSDVLKTKVVADDKTFYSSFNQKMLILKDYPELVFDETQQGSYIPATGDLSKVRFGRFRADSTSARFVAKVLCPWGYLDDIPCVSFNYPNEQVAKEQGLTTSNVLEDTKTFFYANTATGSQADTEARQEFDRIYTYYKNLEGKNFNASNRQVLYRDKLRRQWDAEYEQTAHATGQSIATLANTMSALDPTSDEYQSYQMAIADLTARMDQIRQTYIKRTAPLHDTKVWTAREFDLSQVDEHHRRVSTFLPYFGPCSAPTSAFVTFSLGGIHGGEYYKSLYEFDQAQLETRKALRQALEDAFDASGLESKATWAKSFSTFEFKGKTYKRSELITVSKNGQVKFKPLVANLQPVQLLKYSSDGKVELNERYRFTSMAEANHEDFKSYYPMLLMMLAAFVNPRFHTEGDKDRYMKFFEGKEHFGALIKDTSLDEITRELYKLIQAGYKLFLNSASGAGDVPYDTPIRMNNVIISMRAIGQLFTWRVGQAQAFEGALVISSNTDGLYTVFDEALNNAILEEQSKVINVQIDPERQIIISKDTNNRLILKASKDFKVTGDLFADAQHMEIEEHSGAQLAHASGPIISKSPVAPAITYHALAKYLALVYLADTYSYDADISLSKPANLQVMEQIIREYLDTRPIRDILTNFQQIIKSSSTGPSFPYAVHSSAVQEVVTQTSSRSKSKKKDYRVDAGAVLRDKSLLQVLPDINRIFWVKDQEGPTIQYATFSSRTASAISSDIQCPVAQEVMSAKGIVKTNTEHSYWPQGKTLSTGKYSGLERTQVVAIENGDFHLMESTAQDLIDRLDIKVYAQAAAKMFDKSWMNKPLEAYA